MSKIDYVAVLKKLDEKTEELKKDKRYDPSYWNGDDWGSISGVRDAAEWMTSSRAAYLEELLKIK